ncbi:MAG: hypothetical protein ACI4QX_01085 [Lachnospiraceae bacterium]
MKIMICNHELEFDPALVEEFEQTVCDSFKASAESYLTANFREPDLEKVFREHTEEEIKATIINAAQKEIALFRGDM